MRFLLIIILLFSSSSYAWWDGERKGFILGTGAGAGAQTSYFYNAKKGEKEKETKNWVVGPTRIGYAYDNFSSIKFYQEVYDAGNTINALTYRTYDAE